MSGQAGNQHGTVDGTNDPRSDFHVFDDLQSLHDSENAWADLFACMQQDGESVLQYSDRVIGIAQQLVDVDPALYECLVFHRVKAGLRKPIKDMLISNTVQPNSHAMLDRVVLAIEQKLGWKDPEMPIDNLTPRLTPTLSGDNVQRFRNDKHINNNALAIRNTSQHSANAERLGRHHQRQSWEYDQTPQQQPFKNESRASHSSSSNNHPDSGAFQIRGLHQVQQRPGAPGAPQQPRQDIPGASHYNPANNPTDTAPSLLGSHQVQHTATPSKGLKRPGPDGDQSQNEPNNQPARKKVPWQEYNQRRKQQGPIVCNYCKETGHLKNQCPTNPRNAFLAQ
ncbi:MAG: hypothetical protein Q9226_002122 [Calogaya cf. arnoldii]